MRTIKIGAFALSMCFVLVAIAPAQNSDKEKPAADKKEKDFTAGPGIEIGNDMPDIKLKNQDGNEVSIHELLKVNNVALVFYRSADW